MNLLKQLIKEALLFEAKENAEFLVKLNYDALKKEHPGMDSRELHKLARKGPFYKAAIIEFINKMSRPGGYERPFIKWLGDVLYRPENMLDINYVYDWYLGDENAKNRINDLTFADAFDAAVNWHESLKKKNFDTEIADEGKTKTVYKFGNGSKIVELSWEDCDAEGDSMGHCVGELHTDLVKDGEEKVFSLRSETNKPHVTISVDPKTNKVLEIKGRENKVPVQKHAKLIKEWLKTTNFDYVSCSDYFNILSMNEKKEMLQVAKEKNIKSYFDFIFNKLIYVVNLSQQDLTKIALGAAISCVHLVPKVEKTKELLSVIRDWTSGKASDEQVRITNDELWELYWAVENQIPEARAPGSTEAALAAAVTARDVVTAGTPQRTTASRAWVAKDAKLAGIPREDIIASIEKEIGTPLDKFLFKNEEKEVNESLIKSFILIAGDK